MTRCDVLVVGGTHGNEINGAWLVDQWREQPDLLETAGLSLALEIGNPEARAVNRRYVDRDLNRCFTPDRLNQGGQEQELQRARQLLALHGPASATPCRVALDLHSTTAAMGSCLVVYGPPIWPWRHGFKGRLDCRSTCMKRMRPRLDFWWSNGPADW